MVTNSGSATAGPDSTGAGLHATVTGSGPPAILLHGLFGMGSNLGGIARHLAGDFAVHQLDLPNHGRSAWSDAAGLGALAQAVGQYLDARVQPPAALIGHSLGGKVAMELAMGRPAGVAALVIADIAPVTYAPSHAAVFAAIDAVAEAEPTSRSDAARIMRAHLQEENVVQFLLLSLHRVNGAYAWRFNARGLRAGYAQILAEPSADSYAGPVLLVHGARSSYVDEVGLASARRRFPDLTVRSIEDTGHWLHAERPDEFNRIVRGFLQERVLRKPSP